MIIVVAFISLMGYLASSLSSAEQRAMTAERESQQTKEQTQGYTKQISSLQRDNALAKSPGRTTVVLEAADKKAKQGAWAAVTWGELPDGKTFMRINAYGLEPKLDGGKTYHLWMQPLTGAPVDVGALESEPNGSGFAMNSELPAVDQGKSVMLTTDADGSKQPGDTIAKADLPTLKPSMTAPAAASDAPQAKSGSTSQQMHQEPAKTPPASEQKPGK